tara:strand:- start:914 stop:1135 length:222 start_codon:yes stop_codon:yes gene_type:complete
MVELRLRSPREIKLTQEELAMCSLENTEAEAEALRVAVNSQIDDAIEVAKVWARTRKRIPLTSSSMYPIVKHS